MRNQNIITKRNYNPFIGAPLKGFNLVEIIIVVTIIALVSGLALGVYAETMTNTEKQLIKYELKVIADAVQRFNRDMKYPPHFIAELLMPPENVEYRQGRGLVRTSYNWVWRKDDGEIGDSAFSGRHCLYSMDSMRGWRGPYLKIENLSSISLDSSTVSEMRKESGFSGEDESVVVFINEDLPLKTLITDYSVCLQQCSDGDTVKSYSECLLSDTPCHILSNYRLHYDYLKQVIFVELFSGYEYTKGSQNKWKEATEIVIDVGNTGIRPVYIPK